MSDHPIIHASPVPVKQPPQSRLISHGDTGLAAPIVDGTATPTPSIVAPSPAAPLSLPAIHSDTGVPDPPRNNQGRMRALSARKVTSTSSSSLIQCDQSWANLHRAGSDATALRALAEHLHTNSGKPLPAPPASTCCFCDRSPSSGVFQISSFPRCWQCDQCMITRQPPAPCNHYSVSLGRTTFTDSQTHSQGQSGQLVQPVPATKVVATPEAPADEFPPLQNPTTQAAQAPQQQHQGPPQQQMHNQRQQQQHPQPRPVTTTAVGDTRSDLQTRSVRSSRVAAPGFVTSTATALAPTLSGRP